jgi:hypothetical protein
VGGKTSQTSSQVQIPPEVLARYNSVNATAEQVAQTPFQQYSTNPNAFVAPLTSTQTSGIQNTNAAAGMAQPYFQAGTGFALAGAQPVNAQPLDTGAYMNPYLQTVLGSTEAMVNQQNQQAMSGQTGNAMAQGYFGGDRSGIASAVLQGQQELAGGQLYSGIASDAYQQALAAAQQQQGVGLGAAQANRAALQQTGQTLAGLGTGAQGAALEGAQAQLGAGQVEQQTSQAGLSALYNQFLQQQSYPFQTAQFLANIAEGTGALSGSTTTSTQPGGLFSDERLKEDMEPIGKGFDGANIYRFRYRGDPTTRIGMSAQEVERKHPEAVGEAGGYKTVDYKRATDDAAAGGFALAANDNHGEERRARQAGGGMSEWGAYPSGVNPMVIAQLLEAQAQMYGPSFGGAGLYGGSATGAPHGGAAGYVPQATLPIGALQVAHPPEQPQKSALDQAASMAGDVNTLATDADKAGSWLGNQKWSPTYKASEHMDDPTVVAPTSTPNQSLDAAYAAGEANGGFIRARQDGGGLGGDDNPYAPKGPGLNIPTQGMATPKLATAAAPSGGGGGLLGQAAGAAGDVSSLIGAGKAIGSVGSGLAGLLGGAGAAGAGMAGVGAGIGAGASGMASLLPFLMLQRGGRVGYADGGDTDPYGHGPGLDIPEETPRASLAVAQPPKQGGGGDQTMSDIMDVAKIAAMFAARGGRIGKQDGGELLGIGDGYSLPPDAPDTPAAPPPKPPPRPAPTLDDQFSERLFETNPPAGFGYVMTKGLGDYARGPHPAIDAANRAMDANIAAGMKEPPPQTAAAPAGRPAAAPASAATAPAASQAATEAQMRGAFTAGPGRTIAPARRAPPPHRPAAPGLGFTPDTGRVSPDIPLTPASLAAAAATGMPSTAPAISGFGAAAAPVSDIDAAAGLGQGTPSAAAASGMPSTAPNLGGFSRAGVSPPAPPPAVADPADPTTPRPVQHIGGPPLPTTDAAGNPATPGAVQHEAGPGFAAAAQGGQGQPSTPDGAHAAATAHQGGFGGILGAAAHALAVPFEAVAGMAGYNPQTHQWNRDQLIPFISAVTSMLAAPTKYPLVALTQGLNAGAQSYMQQQGREASLSGAQLQNIQAATNLLPADMRSSFRAVPGAGGPGQQTVTVGNQQFHYEPVWSLWQGAGGQQGQQGGQGGQGGAPAAAPPAGGQAPGIGSQATAAVAAQQEDAFKPDYDTGTLGIAPGSRGKTYMAQNFATQLGPGAPRLDPSMPVPEKLALLRASEGGEKGFEAAEERAAKANDIQAGDPESAPYVREALSTYAQAIAAGPESGLLATGPGDSATVQAAQFANRLLKGFGLPPLEGLEQAGDAKQVMDKLAVYLGQAASRGDHPAASSMEALAEVLPSLETNKGAALKILSQMQVRNEKQLDFQQYRQAHHALWGTEQGALQSWKADSADRYDNEQAMLPRIYYRPKGGGQSIAEQYAAHRTDPQWRKMLEQGEPGPNGHPGLGGGALRYVGGAY